MCSSLILEETIGHLSAEQKIASEPRNILSNQASVLYEGIICT
jgi:hypothetical protein